MRTARFGLHCVHNAMYTAAGPLVSLGCTFAVVHAARKNDVHRNVLCVL